MEGPGENVANESFVTTNWSVVLAAGARGSADAEEALGALCRTYWYPLYTFARWQGHDAALAEDLTQGFFEAFLEKEFLKNVDRSHGRFRSFLLAAFKHYIANQQRAVRTQKRGGDRCILSIDLARAEQRFAQEPYHEKTAEQLFEHQWALTLLDHVLALLRGEYETSGRKEVYDQLRVFLSGDHEATYREVGIRLAMTEGAVKVAVHRLRQRYAELLRLEIGRTVASADDVEDEIRNLLKTLA